MLNLQMYKTFADGGMTATSGTVFNYLVQPDLGKSAPVKPNTTISPKYTSGQRGFSHVTKLFYRITGSGFQNIFWMRPLNYTYVTATVAAGANAINILYDPGLYQSTTSFTLGDFTGTTYRYGPTPDTASRSAINTNDWVAYQIASGLYVADQVSSVSTLAITMTNNIPTGGINPNTRFYLFGATSDTVPYTRNAHPKWTIDPNAATTYAALTREYPLGGDGVGLFSTLHPGDPILVLCNNDAPSTGVIEMISGGYTEW